MRGDATGREWEETLQGVNERRRYRAEWEETLLGVNERRRYRT